MEIESWVPVRGKSMWPLVADGDEVLVRWDLERASRYRLGDVVLVRESEGSWILHRLVQEGPELILMGDSTRVLEPIAREQIFGRAIARRRNSQSKKISLHTTWLDRGIASFLFFLGRHRRFPVRAIGRMLPPLLWIRNKWTQILNR